MAQQRESREELDSQEQVLKLDAIVKELHDKLMGQISPREWYHLIAMELAQGAWTAGIRDAERASELMRDVLAHAEAYFEQVRQRAEAEKKIN